ncbi:transposase, partial [Escherichia coli]|uniref:transposase n=2 Tax=Escherichia coli TaxID=562 RepID=UPI0020239596
PSGKNIIRWLLKKRTNGSVRYCQYTSLFTKRLEEGQFIWPAVRDGKVSITRSQLAMLLDKLDWRQPKTSRLNALTML